MIMSKLVQDGETVDSAGTGQAITTDTTLTATSVIIQALPGNTDKIYVGDLNVSSSAYVVALDAGDVYVFTGDALKGGYTSLIELADIWIDSAVTAEGITFGYAKNTDKSHFN